jgi:hypothetical protein
MTDNTAFRVSMGVLVAVFAIAAGAGVGLVRDMATDCRTPLVLRTTLPPDALARPLHDWMAGCETQRALCRQPAALADHGNACDYAADVCAASWKEQP